VPVEPLPERERGYIRPEYAAKFACIGPACEDNCCSGWGVPVDKATYEKYESHEAMKPYLGTLVVLNANSESASDHARIPQTVGKACPFLDAEKMCGVQKTLGETMLPHTCATYPRALSMHSEVDETALNLSCPEAARLTLLDSALLGQGHWSGRATERYAALRHDVWHTPKDFQPRLAVREFVLLVLTDREYPLWQRLYMLGTFMGQLDRLRGAVTVGEWCDQNPARVLQEIGDCARRISQGQSRCMMDGIQAKPLEQLQLLIGMLSTCVISAPLRERFREQLDSFEAGIGRNVATTEAEVLDRYKDGYERFYMPVSKQYPQILENYLINHVFKNNFPFGGKGSKSERVSARSEHVMMCAHAAMVQTMAIGIAARHREDFNEMHLVNLVQSLARTLEHCRAAIEGVQDLIAAKGLMGQQGIALLLVQSGPACN
jgi:lysine-N-methylase